MAKSSKIRVMLSSRNNDMFPAGGGAGSLPLTEVRAALKAEIEAIELLGKPVFEVWINEQAPAAAATLDIWDKCLAEVDDADVVIALSNGRAGWTKPNGGTGICHAELMRAYDTAPGKLQLISLGNAGGPAAEKERNARFQKYMDEIGLFGGQVKTIEELRSRVKDALREAVVRLTQSGVVEAGRGRGYLGQALDWRRLDFKGRKEAMEAVLRKAMAQRPGASMQKDKVLVDLDGEKVLMVPHAIPAAFSVPAARELVGQPFLKDHELAPLLKKAGGPVHVIACHKTATETQATALLGFADATLVSAPFGVYVADNVQKVQFVFIVNCRDETTSRYGVQRFFDWLETAGEAAHMARRAQSRARIVAAIAGEDAGA
jgi:Domain of unknown function (DUF4062)